MLDLVSSLTVKSRRATFFIAVASFLMGESSILLTNIATATPRITLNIITQPFSEMCSVMLKK